MRALDTFAAVSFCILHFHVSWMYTGNHDGFKVIRTVCHYQILPEQGKPHRTSVYVHAK